MTFPTVYDDGSSITETGRAIISLGGGNYGFTLGVGTGVRNIPRGGYPVALPIASNGGALTATPFADGGQIAAGTYKYIVTLLTQFGESPELSLASVVTTTAVSSVVLTNIPIIGTNVSDANPILGRRIYRTTIASTNASATLWLVTQIDDATTTSFVDTLLDADLGPSLLTPHADTSGLIGVLSLATTTNPSVGTITAWAEVALPSPLAPLANHTGTTSKFAVDYSYGPQGGTVYVSGDVHDGIVNTAYIGGTVPSAAFQNQITTALTAVETAILGGGAAHPNNANIQLASGNKIGWGAVDGSLPYIQGSGDNILILVNAGLNLVYTTLSLGGSGSNITTLADKISFNGKAHIDGSGALPTSVGFFTNCDSFAWVIAGTDLRGSFFIRAIATGEVIGFVTFANPFSTPPVVVVSMGVAPGNEIVRAQAETGTSFIFTIINATADTNYIINYIVIQ